MTKLIRAFLAIITLALLSACGGGGGSAGNTSGAALYTTAPDSVVIAPGAAQTYTINGGVPSYTVTSNSGAASVSLSGTKFTITGGGGGTATVTVTDSQGVKVLIAVSVGSNIDLATSAPKDITLTVGSQSSVFDITGGSLSYTVSSGSQQIVSVTQNGSQFYLRGISTGKATVTVNDTLGHSIALTVTVPQVDLFTSAPATIAMGIGAGSDVYTIGGGSKVYTVVSNNLQVVTVSQNGAQFSLTGILPGSAIVTINDSLGQSKQINVTVSVADLITTAPVNIVLAIGAKSDLYSIAGGSKVYSVVSNNQQVVTVTQSGSQFYLNGVTAGTAIVTVNDSLGQSKALNVKVGSVLDLFTTAPAAITVPSGTTSAAYSIGGGTLLYSVSTSNQSVATVTQIGSQFTITAVSPGTATIAVTDSAGTSKTIAVTVGLGAALQVTAPTDLVIMLGQSSDSFTISGGSAPYKVLSSANSVVTATQVGAQFSLNSVSVGKAVVTILDSLGSLKTVNVTVSAVDLYTTAPASLTLSAGTKSTSFNIGGGSPAYTVTSSNLQVAQVVASGSSFYVNGLTKGTVTISITDSVGTVKTISAIVGSAVALFTTAPTDLDLGIGSNSGSFQIAGGDPAYAITTSNSQVATVSLTLNTFTITGVSSGKAIITVTDSFGQKVPVNVTVGSGSDLYTTAPSAVTIGVGTASVSYLIGGGSKSYTVTTGNNQVATVTQNGNQFIINGLTLGATKVTVSDSLGASKSIDVNVVNGLQLFTTAPSALTVGVGKNSATYQISGGSPVYTVATSNSAVVSVSQVGTQFYLTGGMVGHATVVITDSVGGSKPIDVTVTSGSDLFTTAPAAVAIGVGVSSQSFQIGGGSLSYLVSTANSQIATITLQGNTFTVNGISVGKTSVFVTDTLGASKQIDVSVGSAVDLFVTSPPNLTISIGATSPSYQIGGGTAPYAVTSSNPQILGVTLTGTQFTIKGLATGNANVIVTDALGATKTVSVVIGSGIDLYTSAPSAIIVSVNASSAVFNIGGGSEIYTVSISDDRVATIGQNNNKQFLVTGRAGGKAIVSVKDSAGKEITINVIVGTPDNLFSTAADNIVLQVGGANTFKVAGGTGVYRVSTSNTIVAQASITGNDLLITGVGSGTAVVVVTDETNGKLTINVSVGSSVPISLFVTAPSSIIVKPGATPTFTIGGGKAPYAATTSNPGVILASVNGTTLSLTGVAAGVATVNVTDLAGVSVPITVTISAGNIVALFTTAPTPITIVRGASATYQIGGGTAPFTVTSSNVAVATASLATASTFTINGVAAGNAQVSIQDSLGLTIVRDITITNSPSVAISVAPGDSQGAVGDTLNFNVSGGTAPYTLANNNNPTVATVTSPTLSAGVYSFTAKLLNIGSTTITLLDSQGQSKNVTISVVASVKALRLSPSVFTIGEDDLAKIPLQVYGGVGPYNIYTSDLILSSVPGNPIVAPITNPIVGPSFNVGLGSQTNRCFNRYDANGNYIPGATYDITITAVDSTGVSATATMTVKDNSQGGTHPIGPLACN